MTKATPQEELGQFLRQQFLITRELAPVQALREWVIPLEDMEPISPQIIKELAKRTNKTVEDIRNIGNWAHEDLSIFKQIVEEQHEQRHKDFMQSLYVSAFKTLMNEEGKTEAPNMPKYLGYMPIKSLVTGYFFVVHDELDPLAAGELTTEEQKEMKELFHKLDDFALQFYQQFPQGNSYALLSAYCEAYQETHILHKNDSLFPSINYSPKDKPNNTYFDNKIKGLINAIRTAPHKSADYVVVVKLAIAKQTANAFIKTEYTRAVHDAVCTIMVTNPGLKTITSEMIHRVMTRNPKAQLTKKAAFDINRNMLALNSERITLVTDPTGDEKLWLQGTKGLNVKGEREIYKNLDRVYTDNILAFQGSEGFYDEKADEYIFTVWEMYNLPIFYRYAKAKNQVAATPMKMLNTSKTMNANQRRIEISNYLQRYIDSIRKSRGKIKPIVLFETIYKLVDAGNSGVKKMRARDNTTKILDQFKENGLIEGYEVITAKKGRHNFFQKIRLILQKENVIHGNKKRNS